jgi:uncharacterized RDD family membrane protein YckC
LIEPSLPLAGLRRRLASMLYEILVSLGVLMVGFLFPHLILGLTMQATLPGPVLFSHIFLVLGLYFVWYWQRCGQTLAMQTWKLKLTSATGRPVSVAQWCLRYVLCWPSLLFYGAGILWALLDRDGQFLHDRLAGTRIVTVVPPTTASPPPP